MSLIYFGDCVGCFVHFKNTMNEWEDLLMQKAAKRNLESLKGIKIL